MFKSLMNALKVKEIRMKILFTLAMLALIRLGSAIPVPGMNTSVFKNWFQGLTESDAFGFMDRFTGGSFENMSILALNITPYITSSLSFNFSHLQFRNSRNGNEMVKTEERS